MVHGQISTFELEQLRRTKQQLDAVQGQVVSLGAGSHGSAGNTMAGIDRGMNSHGCMNLQCLMVLKTD